MADELIEALERANKNEEPSPFGKETIIVYGSPASVQSSKVIRNDYLQSIRDKLTNLQYILTGEIFLNITWLVSAKHRYETDAKSDIDNCIKPIIDAFTGPKGLFIDDCQLRGLYICWRHIESDDERLVFDFEFQSDQFSLKDELAFVQIDGALCTPVNLNWPLGVREIWVSALNKNEISKNKLEDLGVPYLAVSGLLAGNQPFHRTRINGFRVLSPIEFSSC